MTAKKILIQKPALWVLLVFSLLVVGFQHKLLIPHGLSGHYFANTAWQGEPVLQSIDLALNESYLQTNRELFARNRRPFSVFWKGYIYVPVNGDRFFSVNGSGKTGVYVNGLPILSHGDSDKSFSTSAPIKLNRGLYSLEIRYTHQSGVPFFNLRWGPTPTYQKPIPSIQYITRNTRDDLYITDGIIRILRTGLFFCWILVLVTYALSGISSSRWKGLSAFILFSILSCGLTYPLVTHFSTHTVGDGWDAPYHVWALWIFNYLLLNGQHPFLTNLLFFPLETNLYFMSPPLLKSLLYLPLHYFLSPLVIQNILYLLSFVISGTGMFLLAHHFTGSHRAGLIAGFIFAFCPYRYAHSLGHFNLTSTEWLPFFILYLLKFDRTRSFKHGVLTGLFFLFNALVCFYYMVFCIIFSAFFFFYQLLDHPSIFRDGRYYRGALGALLIFATGFSPYLLGMGGEMATHGNYVTFPLEWTNRYGADLLAYIMPSVFHPIWGSEMKPLHMELHGGTNLSESVIFAGYFPLLLALIAVLLSRNARKLTFFFLICLIGFMLFSFGPYLYINGHGGFQIFSYSFRIPMPFLILYKIPLMNAIRVPSRYSIMAMLFVALLAAKGFHEIFSRLNPEKIGYNFFSTLVFLFIAIEFLAIPYPIDHVSTPAIYNTIAEDPETVSVLSLPYLAKHSLSARQQYYQTVHHKPLLFGYLGRAPMEVLGYHLDLPLLRTLYQLNTGYHPDVNQLSWDRNIAPVILNFLQLKYIVVDTRYYTDEHLQVLEHYLQSVFPVEESTNQGFQRLYKVNYNPYPPSTVYISGESHDRNLYLLKGWKKQSIEYPEETFLQADVQSELVLYLAEGSYRLTMDCRLSEGSADLETEFNGRTVERVLIDDTWQTISSEQWYPVFRDGYYRLVIKIHPEQVSHRKVQAKFLVRYIRISRR